MFKKKPIIYLASPYSHRFRIVRWWRALRIQGIVARCINEQDEIIPFSPIGATHPIAHLCPRVQWVDDYDKHILLRFDGVIFVKMPGWDISVGMKKELNLCLEHQIPYAYATPEGIIEVCRNIKEIL